MISGTICDSMKLRSDIIETFCQIKFRLISYLLGGTTVISYNAIRPWQYYQDSRRKEDFW